MPNTLFAFFLTAISSFFMIIGGCLGIQTKKDNTDILCFSLGFSGGIMLYLSFTEILHEASENIQKVYPGNTGYILTTAGFFGGMLFLILFNRLLNHKENHEFSHGNSEECLYKMGIFSAISIGIHNFPEGITTFISTLENPTLGISVAIAIALHNLSVGMAIAIPIYFATGKRRSALFYTFLSSTGAPIGALAAYFFLFRFLNQFIFGLLFAVVSGIMVFICLDEILPTAEKFGKHHLVISGVISGMLVMAFSIIFLHHH
ncbi:MAG: zinc transporter ZupT [Fusobacteriaceae bacterium]